jgi:hypothetical protein
MTELIAAFFAILRKRLNANEVISGFRRGINEIFILPGCYAAHFGN